PHQPFDPPCEVGPSPLRQRAVYSVKISPPLISQARYSFSALAFSSGVAIPLPYGLRPCNAASYLSREVCNRLCAAVSVPEFCTPVRHDSMTASRYPRLVPPRPI